MIKDKIKFNVGTKPKNTDSETLTVRDQEIRAKFISKVAQKGILMTRSIQGCQPIADINLFIVRSAKSIPKGFTHIPELSPSPKLFGQYLDWKKNGLWPEKWDKYKAAFLLEMRSSEMRELLDLIQLRLDEGKSVQLICFCPDCNYCHRDIHAEYFEDLGYTVNRG
jgi:uncharacterized protein YeaO (DUF488 family)